MVKLQFMSDLHLEVGNQYHTYNIPVHAPYLILAGDIGQLHNYDKFLDFLETQCKEFTLVFLVLGNHEFYGLPWEKGQDLALSLSKEPRLLGRLLLLNRKKAELPDHVVLLGCTLWSHIRTESERQVGSIVKDFARIEGWNVQRHNEEHDKDVQWLRNEIQSIRGLNIDNEEYSPRKKIIVVTHHAPIREGSSRPEHLKNPWTDAFATELFHEAPPALLEVASSSNPLTTVDYWIFGHTHFTTECHRGDVKLISNQRGYVYPWLSQPAAKSDTQHPRGNSQTQTVTARKLLSFSTVSRLFKAGHRLKTQTIQVQVQTQSTTTANDETHIFDVTKVIEI